MLAELMKKTANQTKVTEPQLLNRFLSTKSTSLRKWLQNQLRTINAQGFQEDTKQ